MILFIDCDNLFEWPKWQMVKFKLFNSWIYFVVFNISFLVVNEIKNQEYLHYY